jgi:hypothetical protein
MFRKTNALKHAARARPMSPSPQEAAVVEVKGWSSADREPFWRLDNETRELAAAYAVQLSTAAAAGGQAGYFMQPHSSGERQSFWCIPTLGPKGDLATSTFAFPAFRLVRTSGEQLALTWWCSCSDAMECSHMAFDGRDYAHIEAQAVRSERESPCIHLRAMHVRQPARTRAHSMYDASCIAVVPGRLCWSGTIQ